MAVTRINNNQITDASAGNAYVGVNAASKVQNYTITSQKIANNLTYGSDFTIAGNLTVQGTTTTIDTVNTLIQDPMITLADGQTSGTPTLDIGTIGLRGSENSAVLAWKESALEFVTALSTTTVSNTTFTISSYANLHTGNFIAQGTTSLVGNVIGTNTNFTGNITGGNLVTPGQVSATANITGGNLLTGGLISATGTITSAANVIGGNITTAGQMSAGANITGANLLTGGQVSATGNLVTGANLVASGYATVTGNITGANINTAGLISATGNINGGNLNVSSINTTNISASGNVTGGNLLTAGNVNGAGGQFTGNLTVLGNLNATVGVVYANSGIFYGNSVTGNNAAFAGVPGFTQLGSNVVMQFAGNVNAYSQLNFENINNGTQASTDLVLTADNGNDGSNFINMGITGSTWDGTQTNSLGNALRPNDGYLYTDSGNLIIGTTVPLDHLRIIIGGDNNSYISAEFHDPGTESANTTTGTLTVTGGIGATKNITGANIFTPGVMSSTGNVTGGNLITGGLIAATGAISGANITGANLITGGLITATGNITGANLVVTTNIYDASTMTLVTGTGPIVLNPASNVSVSSKNINNLADPVQDQDAATKNYVDTVAQGLDPKASVVYATATTLAAYTYNNGTSGVGATITANASGALSVDGSTPTAGDRILVKNETSTNQPYNGIYTVTTVGNATAAFQITRSTDFNQGTEVPSAFTFVEFGSTNADTGWVCTTNAPVVMGTTNITFVQFSGAGSYTANTSAGLSLVGTVFNAKVDNITTAFDGGGNIIVKASANLTTPNIGAATGTSLSVTGNVTGGNLLTGGLISATGTITSAANVIGGNITTAGQMSAGANITGANLLTGGQVSATGNLVTGANLVASGYATVTGNITGANLNTAGTVTAATVNAAAIGNAGAAVTAATVSAATIGNAGAALQGATASLTANVTGGNLLTGGLISATSNISTGANLIVSGYATVTGNITGGNLITAGLATVTGNINTSAGVFATGNVTGGNINSPGLATVTGNITGGNLITGGLITSTGNITGGNLITAGLATVTGNINTSAGVFATGNVTGGNINSPGLATVIGNINTSAGVFATGNVTGGNITSPGLATVTGNITSSANIQGANVIGGNIVLTGNSIQMNNPGGTIIINDVQSNTNFAVDGLSPNVFFVNGLANTASFGNSRQITNALVAFNASTSLLMPVGNTGQRPGTGITGMLRFNTTVNNLEIFDNSTWATVGTPSFTVIADQQFTGNGVQTQFTLGSTQTTNSCIVSINGVLQIPNLAYSVSGTDPTCVLTFTEAPAAGDIIDVRQITTTTTVTSISNSSGNAVILANAVAANIDITGNMVTAGNVYGSYILGNGSQLTGIDATLIQNGNSTFSVISSGGNIRANIAGSTVGVFSNTGLEITGSISATNGFIGLDATKIANGTSQVSVVSANGNISSNVAGSTVQLLSANGANITGNVTASQGIVAGLQGYTNDRTYSANLTYPTDTTRMLVGPMTVNTGVTVTLAGSAIVVIL